MRRILKKQTAKKVFINNSKAILMFRVTTVGRDIFGDNKK
jgi:hypothetical protein